MNLQQVFKFTETDLQANKNGHLSPEQQERYHQFQKLTNRYANCGWIGGLFTSFMLVAMFAGLIYEVVLKNGQTEALLIYAGVFGVFFLIVIISLERAYRQQQRMNRNINEQRIHLIEGSISPMLVDDEVHGIQIYDITIVAYSGSLSKKVFDVIEPHKVYRVYYLSVTYGNILLSVETTS